MGDACPRWAAHRPCPSCPWWLTSDPTGARIPNFSMDKMRNLANTVGDHDDFRRIMACHGSGEGSDFPCVGYLIRHGWSNLAVRLAVMDGRLPNLLELTDGDWDADLFPDFHAMLAAYEEAQNQQEQPHA